ncbi:MAG: hypothetical protein OFPII_02340 [Osedax symbiont Rs1]|nr:MAG: hypothetical protein OFPII_02340 [Osedax symbiont Rs1]
MTFVIFYKTAYKCKVSTFWKAHFLENDCLITLLCTDWHHPKSVISLHHTAQALDYTQLEKQPLNL